MLPVANNPKLPEPDLRLVLRRRGTDAAEKIERAWRENVSYPVSCATATHMDDTL